MLGSSTGTGHDPQQLPGQLPQRRQPRHHVRHRRNGDDQFRRQVNEPQFAPAVAVQPDGKYVVVGRTGQTGPIAMARYNPNGSLDTTFGTAGLVTTTLAAVARTPRNAVFLEGNKILVVGTAFFTTGENFAVVRYNSDGSLDTTFGNGGSVVSRSPTSPTRCRRSCFSATARSWPPARPLTAATTTSPSPPERRRLARHHVRQRGAGHLRLRLFQRRCRRAFPAPERPVTRAHEWPRPDAVQCQWHARSDLRPGRHPAVQFAKGFLDLPAR